MLIRARVKVVISELIGRAGPRKYHPRNVSAAIAITTGTKTAETWSASFWIGALLPCASSTRRMICARAVSRPTLVASNLSMPSLLSVAPITGSPGLFSTGSDSPVSIDSSTAERPSTTTPSTGIFSPGPDQHEVAHPDLIHRDFQLGAVAHHARGHRRAAPSAS